MERVPGVVRAVAVAALSGAACSSAAGGPSGPVGHNDAADVMVSDRDAGPLDHPDGSGPGDATQVSTRDVALLGDSTRGVDAVHDTRLPDGFDSAVDGASDAILKLGACVGAGAPITISNQLPYLNISVGTEAGQFGIDFGSTFSSIDLTAFAPPGPTTTGCNASELGVVCTVEDFSFFGPPSSVMLTTEDYSGVGGSLRQAGLIGTDLLSEQVFILDYAGGRAYAASQACSAAALGAIGLVPLTTAGFYENELSLLEPASDVESGAPSEESVPNVPTVPVRIAGASAVAQLDTGFDDDVTPYSVNVNVAFYDAIVGASPGALVRDSALDETLSTCVPGVTETAEAYHLGSGATFDFVQVGGMTARSYANAVVFVKETPSAAESCGGVGTWTAPAAQVGASFYVGMGSLVFDPFAAQVWMPLAP